MKNPAIWDRVGLLLASRDRVKGQSCLFPRPFIGNDESTVCSKGNTFDLAMPRGGKLPDGKDLTLRCKFGDSPLTSSYDKVISRGGVSFDARRLEFLP